MFIKDEAIMVTAGRGMARAEKLLEVLAAVEAEPEEDLLALERLVQRHADNLTACICVFTGWSRERAAFLRTIAGGGLEVIALVVCREAGEVRAALAEDPVPCRHLLLEPPNVQEGTLQAVSRPESVLPVPPRLLLGVALLFWGGVTGHPLVGLGCAFILEARSWIGWRWDFGERGFVRAWALSVLLAVLFLAWFWLQGESIILLFSLLVWMPVFLLPVILAQQYANETSMPLNTFSFIARRKMQLDRAAGRRVDPVRVHIGYPYFCLVLVASALGSAAEWLFYVSLVILFGLGLFFASPVSRRRPLSWSLAMILVAVLGLGISTGLVTLWRVLGGAYQTSGGLQTSTDRIRTAIGQLGKIKQSYRILWRIHDPEPAGPVLFREAVYNLYEYGNWKHSPMIGERPNKDYDDMHSRPLQNGETALRLRDRRVRSRSGCAAPAADPRRREIALPAPPAGLPPDDRAAPCRLRGAQSAGDRAGGEPGSQRGRFRRLLGRRSPLRTPARPRVGPAGAPDAGEQG